MRNKDTQLLAEAYSNIHEDIELSAEDVYSELMHQFSDYPKTNHWTSLIRQAQYSGSNVGENRGLAIAAHTAQKKMDAILNSPEYSEKVQNLIVGRHFEPCALLAKAINK